MGGAKPAAFEVAYREQDGEVAPVVALADGQAKKQHRSQKGDDAAYRKGHAVENGDPLWRQVERPAQRSRPLRPDYLGRSRPQ